MAEAWERCRANGSSASAGCIDFFHASGEAKRETVQSGRRKRDGQKSREKTAIRPDDDVRLAQLVATNTRPATGREPPWLYVLASFHRRLPLLQAFLQRGIEVEQGT